MNWITSNIGALGLIPEFLSEDDPRPAAEQFEENYSHGGGWSPMEKLRVRGKPQDGITALLYPGDPPFIEVGRTKLRDEWVIVYQYGMVAIIQDDGTTEAMRMD